MSKNEKTNASEELEKEEMTVDLELDDGSHVTCAVVTILTVSGKDYIALLPLNEDGENTEGEVWFYRYSENPKDPNEEPALGYIEDDEEYEAVADAFDEFLDTAEFDELVDDESRESKGCRNRDGFSFPVFPWRKKRTSALFALVMAT